MESEALVSGKDMVFYAIALVGMLVVGFFRLDELIFRSKKKKQVHHRPRMVQSKGGLDIEADPDGTPWEKPRKRK